MVLNHFKGSCNVHYGHAVTLLKTFKNTFIIWLGFVLSITITSSPQLGVDTVCVNQNVTLMCRTDENACDMITWYWHNQSQHGDNITVVTTLNEVVYTCVVSKGGYYLEKNMTVRASGE